jgi:putative hydrolase of the HAD superfamily
VNARRYGQTTSCTTFARSDSCGASRQNARRLRRGHNNEQQRTALKQWGTIMARPFDIIAFDADDTLWHNETLFSVTQERFQELLSRYEGVDLTLEKLYEIETRNLNTFGYGIKGFTLSMIEAAIELTQGRIMGYDVQRIIDFSRAMLHAPVQLIDYVGELIPQLAESYTLMLITKGDLFDQESKIAQSGLADYFSQIEIVSEKHKDTYAKILRKNNIAPERFMMVGNSLRSDILPVIEIGGTAVYIPYHLTWAHEQVDLDPEAVQYFTLEHIGQLPGLLEHFSRDE